VDGLSALRSSEQWIMAVWALRVGYLGIAVAITGLIVLLSGSTSWVLAVGVMTWLAAAAVTLTGFVLAIRQLPVPRPGLWTMRMALIRDTVRTRQDRA
jgi:hypothetical protein